MKRVLVLLSSALSAVASCQDAYHAGIALSKDEKYFAVGNGSQSIELYRMKDGKRIRTFSDPANAFYLTKPAFSPDGKYITAGSVAPDGGVNPVWRISDGKIVARVGLRHGASLTSTTAFQTIGFSPDGRYVLGELFSTNGMTEYLAWDARTWSHAFFVSQAPIERSDGWASGVSAVSPTGVLVATILDYGPSFDTWDPTEPDQPMWDHPIFVDFPKEVHYASFSGDGRAFLMAGDGWVSRYRNEDGNKGKHRNPYVVPKTETVPNFVVRSLASNLDGSEAYLGSRDGRIARFDLKLNKAVKIWQAFPEPVKGLVLTKDLRLLAYDLKSVRIFTVNGQRLR